MHPMLPQTFLSNGFLWLPRSLSLVKELIHQRWQALPSSWSHRDLRWEWKLHKTKKRYELELWSLERIAVPVLADEKEGLSSHIWIWRDWSQSDRSQAGEHMLSQEFGKLANRQTKQQLIWWPGFLKSLSIKEKKLLLGSSHMADQ